MGIDDFIEPFTKRLLRDDSLVDAAALYISPSQPALVNVMRCLADIKVQLDVLLDRTKYLDAPMFTKDETDPRVKVERCQEEE